MILFTEAIPKSITLLSTRFNPGYNNGRWYVITTMVRASGDLLEAVI